jgi:hypothetical protein
MNIRGSIPVNAERRVRALSLVLTRGPLKYDADTIKRWAADNQWRAFRADLARYRKQGYSGWASEGFLGARDPSTSKSSSPIPTSMALDAHSVDIGGRKQAVHDGDPH